MIVSHKRPVVRFLSKKQETSLVNFNVIAPVTTSNVRVNSMLGEIHSKKALLTVVD